jgi:hypothetical protein
MKPQELRDLEATHELGPIGEDKQREAQRETLLMAK